MLRVELKKRFFVIWIFEFFPALFSAKVLTDDFEFKLVFNVFLYFFTFVFIIHNRYEDLQSSTHEKNNPFNYHPPSLLPYLAPHSHMPGFTLHSTREQNNSCFFVYMNKLWGENRQETWRSFLQTFLFSPRAWTIAFQHVVIIRFHSFVRIKRESRFSFYFIQRKAFSCLHVSLASYFSFCFPLNMSINFFPLSLYIYFQCLCARDWFNLILRK